MTIASAITAAQGRVANAYTAVNDMGGTIPATQNLANLPTAIRSISTVNNQNKTFTTNGTYTADTGYTGLGTVTVALPLGPVTINQNVTLTAQSAGLQGFSSVTVNVPQGDIVTATNNTGANIVLGDKVWLEKVAGQGFVLKNIYATDRGHRWFESSSISNMPSVDDTTGVVSNFSSTNAGPMHYMSIDFTKPWAFYVHVKTPTSFGNNFIYSGDVNTQVGALNMGFWIRADSGVWEFMPNSGDGGIISSTAATTNKQYWLKVGWTGTEYFGQVSEDGTTYTDFGTRKQSTTPCTQTGSAFILGVLKWFSGTWGVGSIYMGDTYFEVNGVVVWRGYYPQITLSTLTGFANENIANGASGEVKTILPEEVTVTVTTDADNADITAE